MKTIPSVIVSLLLGIITILLGLILWGGQQYVSEQEKTNRDNHKMFQEYIKSSTIRDAACEGNKENIGKHETRIGVLELSDQGQNEKLVKHATEINHFKDYIN